jgi:hypothetical protein
MSFEGLAAGWEVWNREQRAVILTYRPDVFDSEEFPAPCLPTIHVRKGARSRRPGRNVPDPDAPWYVTLYLEPEVSGSRERYDTRDAAREAAIDLAGAFAAGEVDYRSLYQVPRPDYLDRLDELTGVDTEDTT